ADVMMGVGEAVLVEGRLAGCRQADENDALGHLPMIAPGHDRTSESVFAEPRENRGLEIRLGPGHRQIDVSIRDSVEQRANELRAADRRTALRPDIGGQSIQEDDLTIEQHDGDLGPRFVVDRWTSWFSSGRVRAPGRRENVGGYFRKSGPAAPRHSVLP